MKKYFVYRNTKFPGTAFAGEYIDMGTGIYDGWTHYYRLKADGSRGEECYMKIAPEEITEHDSQTDAINALQSSVIASEINHPFQPISSDTAKGTVATVEDTNSDEEKIEDVLQQLKQFQGNKDGNSEPVVVAPSPTPQPQQKKKRHRRTKAEMAAARAEAARLQAEEEERQRMEQEAEQKKKVREQWLNLFAGVVAALVVIGVVVMGAGAIALLAFAGAGGLLAKA